MKTSPLKVRCPKCDEVTIHIVSVDKEATDRLKFTLRRISQPGSSETHQVKERECWECGHKRREL